MRHLRSAVLAITAALLVVQAPPARAIGGQLDTSFGGDGKVVTNFTRNGDIASGVAVQADGRLVVAGVSNYYTRDSRFALARYDTDGSLDGTFGNNGRVTTDLTPHRDEANSVAIQSDGKIVAAGESAGRFALVRYDATGALDPTFGGDGTVTTNISSGEDFVYSIAIQPLDGKIVVAGGAGGAGGQIAVTRYNTNGDLDSAFGIRLTDITLRDDRADDVAIQPTDGTIVIVGTADYFTTGARLAVVRYRANGALDNTFGHHGKVLTDFPTGHGVWGSAVSLQSDGKIVAGGQVGGGDTARMGLARFDNDGTLDGSFSGDGMVTVDVTDRLDYVEDLAVQESDGNIVAAGSTAYYGPDARFAVARFKTDGTLDGSFGGDGMVTTNFTSGLDRIYGVSIQADGNIVTVGRTEGRGVQFALARYLAA